MIATFGGVDVLVNNAAVILRCEPQDLTDAQAQSVLEVNLFGGSAAPGGGVRRPCAVRLPRSIVNVTSTTGRLGTLDSTAYAMPKQG